MSDLDDLSPEAIEQGTNELLRRAEEAVAKTHQELLQPASEVAPKPATTTHEMTVEVKYTAHPPQEMTVEVTTAPPTARVFSPEGAVLVARPLQP
jgi:hypothetical protein